ncbi:MAG TPA: helix-turn-helix domain-containing protein [Gaiellaceae bacterium]|jgi:AcrR family transcriptional regulator
MGVADNRRRYDTSRRQAAAAERRLAVVAAAREAFERRGWAAVRVREIAEAAGVSQKLVEAVFGTKAALLQAAVDYAIRGDVDPLPMPERESAQAMEAAPDAAEMLRLHARHLRRVNARSARIASVVEHAAPADPAVAALWREMNRNRRYAVDWATDTFLAKRGRRRGLRRARVAATFWVALDWGTYRTLTAHAGLDDDGYERWLRSYYVSQLLPPA